MKITHKFDKERAGRKTNGYNIKRRQEGKIDKEAKIEAHRKRIHIEQKTLTQSPTIQEFSHPAFLFLVLQVTPRSVGHAKGK